MTGLRTIELTDGGILLYDDAFLPSELADRYFVELRDECVWEQKPGVFGHMQPRLTASYGDEGVTYRYSGTTGMPSLSQTTNRWLFQDSTLPKKQQTQITSLHRLEM